MNRRNSAPAVLGDGEPFSLEGYIVVRKAILPKRSPVGGNRRIPICFYCGNRHKLQKIKKHKSELFNGVCVEYEEDWYYCGETELPFMTRQMDEKNRQRRNEAYKQSPLTKLTDEAE